MNRKEHEEHWKEAWWEQALLARLFAPMIAFAVIVVIVVPFVWLSTSHVKPPTDTKSAIEAGENALDQVREILKRATDLSACRGAVQQLNAYLTQERQKRPAA